MTPSSTCRALRARPLLRRPYSTKPSDADKIQTPLQTQRKSAFAPPHLQPTPTDAPVQTPLQSQTPAAITPQTPRQPAQRQQQQQQPPLKPSNAGPLYTLFGLLLIGPPVTYYYWEYRKQHMFEKKHKLLEEAQARYRAGEGA